MLETIIVIAVVVLAAVWVLRSLYRETTGRKTGCACGDRCPGSGRCTGGPVELKTK